MTIDELYSYYGTAGVSSVNNVASVQQATSDDEQSSDTAGVVSGSGADAYISTITSQTAELRSENYNDILEQMRQAKETIANGGASEESASASQGASSGDAVSGAGGSGGGSSDDEEEETTTVVMINGQAYLETTTVNADGTTTVTRTPIGTSSDNEDNAAQTMTASTVANSVTL
jgi:ribosomal protein L12E/L44/L45/RPP1/RPP2